MGRRGPAVKKLDPSRLLVIAERALSQGDSKSALRDAKVCYRVDPGPQTRRILELAFLARVENLRNRDLVAEARVVLGELRQLGPVETKVQEALPRLVALLDSRPGSLQELMAARPTLGSELLDQAVLRDSPLPPVLQAEEAAVVALREAFAAVEAGRDAEAIRLLEAIPRQSPLADWKLFLRGLISFYGADQGRCLANWERLEGSRPAARIARALLDSAGKTAPPNLPACSAVAARRLQDFLCPADLPKSLEELETAFQGKWLKNFLQQLEKWLTRFGASRPDLTEMLRDLTISTIRSPSLTSEMQQITRIFSPPADDPRWNRTWARFWEHASWSDGHELSTFSEPERYWEAYAEDVRSCESIPDADRPLAVSLVYFHAASWLKEQFEDTLDYFTDEDGERRFSPELEEKFNLVAARLDELFSRSLEASPSIPAAYQLYVEFLQQAQRSARALEVQSRHVEAFPEDAEARINFAASLLEFDRLDQAEVQIQAASRLAPRDERLQGLKFLQLQATLAELCQNKRFAEARVELDKELVEFDEQAGRSVLRDRRWPPQCRELYGVALAWKANQAADAETLLAQALAATRAPNAFWIALWQVANRFKLSRERKKFCADQFRSSLSSEMTAEQILATAIQFDRFRRLKIKCLGIVGLEQAFLKTITSRVLARWNLSDLVSLGRFVAAQNLHNPVVYRTLDAIADRGMSQYRRNSFFHLWSGALYLTKAHRSHQFRLAQARLRDALDNAKLTEGFTLEFVREAHELQAECESQLQEDYVWHSAYSAGDFDAEDEFDEEEDEPLWPDPWSTTKSGGSAHRGSQGKSHPPGNPFADLGFPEGKVREALFSMMLVTAAESFAKQFANVTARELRASVTPDGGQSPADLEASVSFPVRQTLNERRKDLQPMMTLFISKLGVTPAEAFDLSVTMLCKMFRTFL